MNLYVTLFTLPIAGAMIWQAFKALNRAHRVGRCARPFIVPIFAGLACLILCSLVVVDMSNSVRTPRDVYFGLQLVIAALIIANILLLIPNIQKRVR